MQMVHLGVVITVQISACSHVEMGLGFIFSSKMYPEMAEPPSNGQHGQEISICPRTGSYDAVGADEGGSGGPKI